MMEEPTPCDCGEIVELNKLKQCTICNMWYCPKCTDDMSDCPNCMYPEG